MTDRHLTRRTLLTGAAALSSAASVGAAGPSSDPLAWTLTEAAAALARGTVSSVELTTLSLARIERLDRRLNAFITIDRESAISQARECDRRRAAGKASGPLDGVPLALKDNIDTAGVRTTAA